MELHYTPEDACTDVIDTATCRRLHTLVLVGHNPLDLSTLAEARCLECLALHLCVGMEASQLLYLTMLRSSLILCLL